MAYECDRTLMLNVMYLRCVLLMILVVDSCLIGIHITSPHSYSYNYLINRIIIDL